MPEAEVLQETPPRTHYSPRETDRQEFACPNGPIGPGDECTTVFDRVTCSVCVVAPDWPDAAAHPGILRKNER